MRAACKKLRDIENLVVVSTALVVSNTAVAAATLRLMLGNVTDIVAKGS